MKKKQKMIRRFPVAIAATTLALSLTASASMAGDGQLGQVAEQLKTALATEMRTTPQQTKTLSGYFGLTTVYPLPVLGPLPTAGDRTTAQSRPILSGAIPGLL